jgi:hypothetical protein
MRRLVVRAVRFELSMWRSLARWVARRPDVAPGATPFAYRGPVLAPILVFIVLSVVEVVAVDLILAPWPAPRRALLVLGIWGTLLMLGMLAAITVHPHVVGESGLRVRYSTSLDVHIPWDAIAGVKRTRRSRDGRTVQLDGGTLHVAISGQTTVDVALARPVPVTVRGNTAQITQLRLHADDAAGLVAAIRARAGAAPCSSSPEG